MNDWTGCAVTIIASGPSKTREDCELVRAWRDADKSGRRVIVINRSYETAMFADVLYACDEPWWEKYIPDVRASGFAGQLWTQDKRAADKYDGVHYVPSQRNAGLSRKTFIYQGGNGGYQAINLAYLWGARRMILLGLDMQATNGRKHDHPDYPQGLDKHSPFPAWREQFDVLAKDLAKDGCDVVNATRETALTCFTRVALEDALRERMAEAAD